MYVYINMKIFRILFFLLLWGHLIAAQNTPISGQINQYAKASAISYCDNTVTVDSIAYFQPGMKVLLIQMQGAIIDLNNTLAFGNVIDYNVAGNYEIETIQSITGNSIKFQYEIERKYNAANSLQLIPLPVYQTATVSSKLYCKPWDGTTGGVLLLQADTLILNDTITVAGRGFRGTIENDPSGCLGLNPSTFGATAVNIGAPKGEGIVQNPFSYARGKNANGGGGGNDHNSGGGGGGNVGIGGIGGIRGTSSSFCQGNYPGIGGLGLLYSNVENRIFMGGAGGAGDENNAEGTGGENGAGICIIIANVLIGNNKPIIAKGNDQNLIAGADAAGGGGAGGTVLLAVNHYSGSLKVNTVGGNGGKLNNGLNPGQCWGPGGGAGGGICWVSLSAFPPAISYIDTGGVNGWDTYNNPGTCLAGTTNGATAGTRGDSLMNLSIPFSVRPFIKLTATFSNDTAVCYNKILTLHATGVSSDTVYYHWNTGLDSANITFNATQSTTYTISVTDANTCTITQQIHVSVDSVMPLFSPDTSLCTPGSVTFHAQNLASTPVTYHWSDLSSLSTLTFFAATTQTYTVTVSSALGCSATASMTATIGSLYINVSPDTTICPGFPVHLTATPTSLGSFSYTWSTGSHATAIDVSPSVPNSYTVTVSSLTGCSTTATINIFIRNLPFTFSPDTIVCHSSPIHLYAIPTLPNTYSYLWNTGDMTPSITQIPTASQGYTIVITDGTGCSTTHNFNVVVDNFSVAYSHDTALCAGGSATLAATPLSGTGYHYTWSDSSHTSAITVSPSSTTLYYVTVSDSVGCSISSLMTVVVAHLGVHYSHDTAICPGRFVTLFAAVDSGGSCRYIWSTGDTTPSITLSPTASHTYIVTITNTVGCIATHGIIVSKDFLGTIAYSDTAICIGGNARLSATVPNVSNVSYLWSSGATTALTTVSPTHSQTYTVSTSSTNGCSGTATVNITIDTVKISLSADTLICPLSPAILTVSAQGIGSTSYRWNTQAQSDSLIVSPANYERYTVTATDAHGCSATGTIAVNTADNATGLSPILTAQPDSATYPSEPIQFTIAGGVFTRYQWLVFDSLSDSTIATPIAYPLRSAQYCVRVYDAHRCAAIVCKHIPVATPPVAVAIPTAFTPNGDNRNEQFRVIPSHGTIIASLKVYDRWGILLYDNESLQDLNILQLGWNGTYKGEAQISEDYTCFVTYYQELYPDKRYRKVGVFTLIR